MNRAYIEMLQETQDAWKHGTVEDERKRKRDIVPDGGRVRVAVSAMDSARQPAPEPAPLNPDDFITDEERREAARAAALEDHFTHKREAADRAFRAANPALAEYMDYMSSAWEGAA